MQKEFTQNIRIAKSITSFFNYSRRLAQDDPHPPTPEETQQLIAYLREQGMNPIIIGSAAIAGHLQLDAATVARDFRPTRDLDIIVKKKPMPTLLYGWKVDPSAIGLVSWISPSGGGVDFLHSGDELPDGRVVPQAVPITDSLEFPIADLSSIFKMKLNSFREGDIKDLSILAKKCGIPELGKLNKQQKENLDYLKIIIGL